MTQPKSKTTPAPEPPHLPEQPYWPDGTPRSQDNAFTAHDYIPGRSAQPTEARLMPTTRPTMPFGMPDGTVPLMEHNKK